MLLRENFRKLLAVCLKMLFRKSTRKRFLCLVVTFLGMMGFNTYSYVRRFHQTEIQKRNLLQEKAFKVFWVRTRSRQDNDRLYARQRDLLEKLGAAVLTRAFIYQNNLYVHVPLLDGPDEGGWPHRAGMALVYDLFHLAPFARGDFRTLSALGDRQTVRNVYFDYSSSGLGGEIATDRGRRLRRDLIDIADMIRGNMEGKRIDVYNGLRRSIVDQLQAVSLGETAAPNPYLSRVASVVPMTILHLLFNIRNDTTTDVIDLAQSVVLAPSGELTTAVEQLTPPAGSGEHMMYADIDIYPRYVPIYTPGLLQSRWNWLLYQDIHIQRDLEHAIEGLHYNGNYLFSYEKLHILKGSVAQVNQAIDTNHVQFYLTDLSMGVAFPFMMSLFAFIHLKTEIAFLLMFKNRIRQILIIFWMLPLGLMLLVKGGVVLFYALYLQAAHSGIAAAMTLPLGITLIAAGAMFYPVNRWCFGPFVGNSLNLYALHKGR